MADREQGFTLIEALVALLILAIASAGLIRALEGSTDAARGLERRQAAQWVAENRLAELRLGQDAVDRAPEVAMLGEQWRVGQQVGSSDDPDIHQVLISVSDRTGARLATLRGFLDAGTTRR